MKTLCILSFLYWTSFKQAGSERCTASTENTKDVYMCTDSKVVNVTEVRLRSSSNYLSPTCSCYLQQDSALSYSFVYKREPEYEIPYNLCGTSIHISNLQFKCNSGATHFESCYASTTIQYTSSEENVSWCIEFKADGEFSMECVAMDTTPVTSLETASLCTSTVTTEKTKSSSQFSVTTLESFTSSQLLTSDSPKGTSAVTTLRSKTDYTTNSQTSHDILNATTTSVNLNEHTTVTQTGKGLQDTHIVIIAVSTTCFVLIAITLSAVSCHLYRKAKLAHHYENNALEDTTNLQSKHDYTNTATKKNSDLEVINPMYSAADAIDGVQINQTDPSIGDTYADVCEITVKNNAETDNRVVITMSKESDQGINGKAEIHENGILEPDVDTHYAVVQKNRDTDSKAKKVSFNVNNQDLHAIPVESNGTDNLYAQVNKKSETRK